MLTTFVIKTVYSAVLGFIIGIQREKVGKPAGSRTYSLIALASTVFTIMSQSGFSGINIFSTGIDPTRIASQIVVGIGFLGAGIIIFHDDKILGLTTAAGMWAVAALGMVVGVGLYIEAAVLAILIVGILLLSSFQVKSGWLKK